VTSAEATCDVEKGEINTKPVTSQAEGEPEPLLDRFADAEIKFSPTTPPEFVGIKIVNKPGKTCLLAKTLKVTGATACDVATLAEADAEQENHKLVCVAVTGGVEESTLELAAKPAEFSGEATIKLESKKVWSLAEGS
jgi:hypothetical protein